MKNRIEQEIDQTLSCLNESDSIQVSDLFIDAVSGKISHLHTRRGIGYRSRIIYPVILLLMVGLNLAFLFINRGGDEAGVNGSTDSLGIVASEYGLGQSSYMAL